MVFENRVLTKVFGPKGKKQKSGENFKMSSFVIFTTVHLIKQHSGYQSRKNETDMSFGKHRKKEKRIQGSSGED
jgi:hypothetical protein